MSLSDHIIANTASLKKLLQGIGIGDGNISVIPTGIDLEFFQGADPQLVRPKYGLGNRPVVLYTGTLDVFQGIDLLLLAFHQVCRQMPEAVLLILGSTVHPEHLEKYRGLAAELGMEGSMILAEAPFSELPHYLAAADVATVPRPTSFGMPVKLLNYLAMGLPVVSFAGSAEILQDTGAALLIPGADWSAFGEGILRLLQDREYASELGQRGRKLIETEYNLPTICDKISQVYQKLVKEQTS